MRVSLGKTPCYNRPMGATTAASLATPVSSTQKKRTFAEFFAGIGLMRLGLEAAGWQIAYTHSPRLTNA